MSGEDSQLKLLSKARRRIGHFLVDQFLEYGGISGVPLSEETQTGLCTILEWEPSQAKQELPGQDVERLTAYQLLSENTPGALRVLSEPLLAESSDSTLESLCSLAARAYPALVFQAEKGAKSPEGTWEPLWLGNEEDHVAAIEESRREGFLAPPKNGDRRDIETSYGVFKKARDFNSPPEMLLYGAWRLCLLRGKWDAESFRKNIKEQLDVVRRASRGEQVTVPLFCGFGGATVEDEFEVDDMFFRPYVGSLQDSLLGHPDRFGVNDGGREPGFIVERRLPWGFEYVSKEDEKEAASVPEFDWQQLAYWGKCVSVSVAASQTKEFLSADDVKNPSSRISAPLLRWVVAGDPVYGANSSHLESSWPQWNSVLTVDAKSFGMAEKFERIKHGAFRIALRRIRKSLVPFGPWEEDLLDSVITWEALSGDCRSAVTLMTTAFLAELISEDGETAQVRNALKEIYRERNTVVHGGIVRDHQKVRRYSDAARVVALVAMKRLVVDHPDLIDEMKRFEKLCLDQDQGKWKWVIDREGKAS